jgi:hypothetical protein
MLFGVGSRPSRSCSIEAILARVAASSSRVLPISLSRRSRAAWRSSLKACMSDVDPTFEDLVDRLGEVVHLVENLPPEFRSAHKSLADLYEKIRRAQSEHSPEKIDPDRKAARG